MVLKSKFKDKKIFVAGAGGMVGGAIYKRLKQEGFCNLLTPKRSEIDLSNSLVVSNWFKEKKPDVVILAAAKVGGILDNANHPADFLLENIKIQNNVIESAWKNNVERFIFLGSSCIYPKFAKQPIKEEYLLQGKLEPTNDSYAIAKIAGIKLCQALNNQYNFDAISLMPTNLYGPGDNYHPENSHVMASLIRKFCDAVKTKSKEVICWGTGSPYREFLYVEDLASAVYFLLENWHPKSIESPRNTSGEPLFHLNVGTGKDISIKELAYQIAKLTGFEGEIVWDRNKPDGTPKKLLDISKIKSLGWEPIINLEEGIKLAINDYRKNYLG